MTFQLTVTGERGESFRDLIGRNVFPIEWPEPVEAEVPGDSNALVYVLTPEQFTADEVDTLAAEIAPRFGLTVEQAVQQITSDGLPILSADCVVKEMGSRCEAAIVRRGQDPPWDED